MSRFPALPLWIDSLSMDTAHLTNEEFGIYLRLLILIWSCPDCQIPNDDKWLASHFHMPVRSVEKKVRPIIEEFCKKDRRFITQGRLKDEWDYKMRTSDNQRTRANSRWGNKKKSTPAMPPIPSPSILKKKNSKNDPVEKAVSDGDKPYLKAKTYEEAARLADGYDIYAIEVSWREGGYAKKANKPDAAFLGFVKTHVKGNKI